MIKSIAAVFSGLLFAALPVSAQTTAELLQKGIYAQETEGNLDNAILIYRQIVNSAPAQRDLAAQAQYRLAQALLQKGDLTTASKEFERLSRDYADYSNLVSSLSQKYYARVGQIQPGAGGRGGRGAVAGTQASADPVIQQYQQQARLAARQARQAKLAELQARLAELRTKYAEGHPSIVETERQVQDLQRGIDASKIEDLQSAIDASKIGELAALTAQSQALFAAEFDPSKPITLTGKVSQVIWVNPRAWLKVDAVTGGSNIPYTMVLGAPNTLVRTGKLTRETFKLGMDVSVTGVLAKDGSAMVRADTISSEGRPIFDRATLAAQ